MMKLRLKMPRTTERMRAAKKLMKQPAGSFIAIDLARSPSVPGWMTRAFQNNWYIVMIDDNAMTTAGHATRAMIQRHDNAPIHSWSELQHIKNELFGKETVAIEYYPKQSELCDQANIYWLWIFPEHVLPMPILKG